MSTLTSTSTDHSADQATHKDCPFGENGSRARVVSWTLQVLAAAILGQTLFFKFTGAPESVAIFTTLGVEPWGRLGSGVLELIVVALLLVPRTAVFGAVGALGMMLGAIGSHLGPLGISVGDDGGTLFAMALVVAGASLGVLFLRRRELIGRLREARRLMG